MSVATASLVLTLVTLATAGLGLLQQNLQLRDLRHELLQERRARADMLKRYERNLSRYHAWFRESGNHDAANDVFMQMAVILRHRESVERDLSPIQLVPPENIHGR